MNKPMSRSRLLIAAMHRAALGALAKAPNGQLTQAQVMQAIQANGYTIYFGKKGYEVLSNFISENNYSNIFILVDNKYDSGLLHLSFSL